MSNPYRESNLPADAVRIEAATGTGSEGRLRAVSSFEPYELVDYLVALKLHLPGVAIDLWRMPTATLTEYLLSGAQCDLILGWAETAAKTPGIAERILCSNAAEVRSETDGFCRPTAFSTAFVVDPSLLRQRGLAVPASWSALADPMLAGGIVFPDPRRSGAGYLALSTLIQCFGDRDGWQLMHDIDRNVVDYPGSAWEPAQRVGTGGVAVGVTVQIAAARRRQAGTGVEIALPSEATGMESEVYGMLRGTVHRQACERVLAWLTSAAAIPYFENHAKIVRHQTKTQTYFELDAERAGRERDIVLCQFGELINSRDDGARRVAGDGQ
jgi:iron(III) transport system substrate-binding protein